MKMTLHGMPLDAEPLIDTTPKRIQLRRTKGWRKPPGTIVVARPSVLGNPYKVGDLATISTRDEIGHVEIFPELAVAAYRHLMLDRLRLDEDRYWRTLLDKIAGHDLACWCPLDQPCHADVLLELANTEI